AKLKAVLDVVGYADVLLTRELPDGRLGIIDGHLRAGIDPEEVVPIVVLDLSEDEADIVLATLDPLASLAGTDPEAFARLYESIEADEELQATLDHLATLAGVELVDEDEPAGGPADPTPIPDVYKIVVECPSEAKQKELLARLCEEGWQCRALVL